MSGGKPQDDPATRMIYVACLPLPPYGQRAVGNLEGRGKRRGKWRGGLGTSDESFGGVEWIGWRDYRLSADGSHAMGEEAGVCPHARGGTPKRESGRKRKLDNDDGGNENKKNQRY